MLVAGFLYMNVIDDDDLPFYGILSPLRIGRFNPDGLPTWTHQQTQVGVVTAGVTGMKNTLPSVKLVAAPASGDAESAGSAVLGGMALMHLML